MAMTDEQRKARLYHHMYETCEGIAEHAERIVRLEEENEKLRQLLYLTETCLDHIGQCGICPLNGIDFEHEDCNCQAIPEMKRLKAELGIEVDNA